MDGSPGVAGAAGIGCAIATLAATPAVSTSDDERMRGR